MDRICAVHVPLDVHFQKNLPRLSILWLRLFSTIQRLYSTKLSKCPENTSSKGQNHQTQSDKFWKFEPLPLFEGIIRGVHCAKLNEIERIPRDTVWKLRIIATVSMPRKHNTNLKFTRSGNGVADMFDFWGTWEDRGP